jgi:hypothetical protein
VLVLTHLARSAPLTRRWLLAGQPAEQIVGQQIGDWLAGTAGRSSRSPRRCSPACQPISLAGIRCSLNGAGALIWRNGWRQAVFHDVTRG